MVTPTTMEVFAPAGSRPTNVPPVIVVSWLRRKSSAVSIPNLPGDDGCEAVAICPSGDPVLTTTVSAFTGTTYAHRRTAEARIGDERILAPPWSGERQRPLPGRSNHLAAGARCIRRSCLEGAQSLAQFGKHVP